VLLVGGESVAVQCLTRLQTREDAEVVGVVPAAGSANPLPKAAFVAGIPTWPVSSVTGPDAGATIRSNDVDVLLNVHSLHLLPGAATAAPHVGAFNLHPGPLPEYAGLNPASWAIFNSEPMHGVTVHAMTDRTDAGPIAFEHRFPIEPDDTALTLSGKCVRAGLELLEELITTVAAGQPVPARHQDLSRRRYFPAGAPNEARIDWEWSSEQISNLVRACTYAPFPSPWGQAWTVSEGARVEVLGVRRLDQPGAAPAGIVLAYEGDSVIIASGTGALLVNRVRVDEERPPPRAVFRLGAVLTQSSEPRETS
jgi:methionyl-tRNA formyltransferase